MAAEATNSDLFKSKVLGHPAGLFVLFFTEMWERFSFYGMRVLLIQFLTAKVLFDDPFSGWGWSAEQAGALYGTYAMLLYLTPILGGVIADKYLGSRNAVITGAIIMTIGHAAMGFDNKIFFFIGLACLVMGTGFFKPNMPSILGEMYQYLPEKKDAAYTIFYMGVNSGAFFGMMICGYLAEEIGWHYGFGLAGIFMLLGTIQFWLSKPLFGTIGEVKKPEDKSIVKTAEQLEEDKETNNPFTLKDYILIGFVSIVGLLYAFNDPLSKNGVLDLFAFMDIKNGSNVIFRGQNIVAIIALVTFIYLVVSRIVRYGKIIRDRMFAVIVLAFFLMFFFMSFEQGATSLVLVARDYVDRTLEGNTLLIFNIINSCLTIIPLLIISWVLILLAKATWHRIALSNITLFICFAAIWALAIWILYGEFIKDESEIKVSWFSILNSFFIIALASSVSKLWDSKYNPPAAYKYGIGLLFVAIGFLILGLGSLTGNETVKMSMIFLVLTYLFHTLGELFISPVGLSYVSKLVPGKMLAFMFGMWYLALAIAQKFAAILGGEIENIKESYSLGHFFFLFTLIPAAAGILVILLHPLLKKLMHGVK